jgi:hypothetical protein
MTFLSLLYQFCAIYLQELLKNNPFRQYPAGFGCDLYLCGDTVRKKAKGLLLYNQGVTEFQPNFALIALNL